MMRNLLWAALIAVLCACQPAVVQQRNDSVPVTASVDDVASWLEEWHQVIALPEDQVMLTLKDRELEFGQSANPKTRLRLALLLAEGPQPVRDQRRALKLLTGLDTGRASDSTRALAALLEQVIREQRWSIDKMKGLNQELKASRTQVEELKLQLLELTTIEQNIQQRELPSSRKEQR